MKKFGEGQQPFYAIVDIPEGDSQELTTVTDQALNSLYGELFNLLQTHGINPTTTTSADLKQVARAVWAAANNATLFIDSGDANNKKLTHIKGGKFLYKLTNANDDGFAVEFINNVTNTSSVTISVLDVENSNYKFNNVPLLMNGEQIKAGKLTKGSYVKAYYDQSSNSFKMVSSGNVADLSSEDEMLGDNLVTVIQKGGVKRTQHAKNADSLNPKDFGAIGDGVTDDTASINNLILELYQRGGGTVFFPNSEYGYKVDDTIYVPSNIKIDGNNQILISDETKSLFKTANVVNGAFVELGDFDSAKIIKNSKIHDFIVKNSALVFDFKSFTLGCSVKNIAFDNCTQGFKLDDCFYSCWENLTATPTSGVADKPFYHLVASSNAMIFDRITATVAWCWLIEGGSTALLFNGCTFEGGVKGFKFKGDNLGLKFQGCYFEAITGTLFDFSEAGVCVIDWNANYINGVDVIFDDGGVNTTSQLFGTWAASNTIVNVGQTLGTPYTFRGLMKVDGAKNNIKFFTSTYKDHLNPVKDANWITGRHTNLQEFANASVDGKANIMAKADIYTGVIPVKYSGDFGTPYINQVPFTTKSTIPTSTNTSFTIDTKLVWQPLSVFAKVVLGFRRAVGGVYQIYYVYGDIYGSNIELKGGIDPSNPAQGAVTATLSNNNGYLRITFSNVQNPNGDLYITGTVRALS